MQNMLTLIKGILTHLTPSSQTLEIISLDHSITGLAPYPLIKTVRWT